MEHESEWIACHLIFWNNRQVAKMVKQLNSGEERSWPKCLWKTVFWLDPLRLNIYKKGNCTQRTWWKIVWGKECVYTHTHTYMYINVYICMLYNRNWHSTVSQLYSNKDKIKKELHTNTITLKKKKRTAHKCSLQGYGFTILKLVSVQNRLEQISRHILWYNSRKKKKKPCCWQLSLYWETECIFKF